MLRCDPVSGYILGYAPSGRYRCFWRKLCGAHRLLLYEVATLIAQGLGELKDLLNSSSDVLTKNCNVLAQL